MNKSIAVLSVIFLVFGLMLASAYSQEDIIQVDNDMFANPQRPACTFKHEKHNETAEIDNCTECHHLYEDGKLVEDESSEDMQCSDCHKEKEVGKTPPLMQAFHINCKGCHQENKSGPIMCGECHVK